MQSTKLEIIKIIENIQSEDILLRLKAFLKDMDRDAKPAKKATALSKEETRLLLKINEGIPESDQLRYNDLLARLARETLSEPERKELLKLTALVEAKNAERLKHLVQLAKLWNASLDEVMDRLGIKPPPIVHA
jgi:hypothetical protein